MLIEFDKLAREQRWITSGAVECNTIVSGH